MKKWWKLWATLAVLALLTPLGLWLPERFGAGGAWGEWGAGDLKKIVGYVPGGMKGLQGLWHAPANNYGFTFMSEKLGYFASAAIGIAVIAAVVFAVGRGLSKDGKKDGRGRAN